MPELGEPAWAGTGEEAVRDSDVRDTLPDVFGSDLAHLFDYCRALLEQDAEAARTVRSVLDSAPGPQQDPDRLRARLLSVGRAQALATRPPSGADPCYLPMALITAPGQGMDEGVLRAFRALTDSYREILDLVYRHGIRAANLAEVLGIPAAEAYRRLAVAEGEFLSLIGEAPGLDADPVASADGGLEDIAALPLAPLAEWTAHPATRLPRGERRSRRRPAQLVTAAAISGAIIGAVVSVGAASHPTYSHGVTVHDSGASAPRTGRSASAKHGSERRLPVYFWEPGDSPTVSSSPSSSVITGPLAPQR
jgi:hypothetical protein